MISGILSAIKPFQSLIGAGLSFIGGQNQNVASAEAAQRQMDFQEQMSNTSYQRQVEDLKAAGINPMLVTKLGGASTPPGAMPSFVNPGLAASQAFSAQQSSEAAKQQAETTERLSTEQMKLVNANTEKVIEEIKNIPIEGERLRQMVFLIARQTDYYQQLGYTEMQRDEMVKATTRKLLAETDLLKFDIQAAQALDNFGRQYKELGPVIQAILSALRR